MASVEELRNLVEKLQMELDGRQPKQFVVYKQERKLKKFNGKLNNDTNNYYSNVEEFISDILAIFASRNMPDVEQVEFIISHLEGTARDEIRLHPRPHQNDPISLLDILRKEFGEKHSLPELFKLFYNRRQKDDESLRQYSHALSSLFERICLKSPHDEEPSDITMRDQFIDNVKDPLLRKELRKLVRIHPRVTFLDVREEALKWSEDEVTSDNPSHSNSRNDVTCKSVSASGNENADLKMLQDAMQKQQKLIEELASTVRNLKSPKGNDNKKKEIICYNCQKVGHFARNCKAPKRPSSNENPPQ